MKYVIIFLIGWVSCGLTRNIIAENSLKEWSKCSETTDCKLRDFTTFEKVIMVYIKPKWK